MEMATLLSDQATTIPYGVQPWAAVIFPNERKHPRNQLQQSIYYWYGTSLLDP